MAQEMKAEQAVSSVTTTGSYRWIVCALLFFATTINYMDRQILSLLKPILDNQLHCKSSYPLCQMQSREQ